ncbi:unnamed protein product [Spirodela intermedia]|nr:unnamed protein product [Spirodela intermedia]CAA6671075.1 unnamed protein product [Spirodela intermedia]
MAAGNSFDQWQKDVFFSAAEEVQDSADVMESMYRMWLRAQSEGHHTDVFIELRRELQTALGTAKWQLEEFERAVRESHRRKPLDKSAVIRHNQFILAMEDQIVQVEKALGQSLVEEGKEPLQWIQLDEEERNDLALFLCTAPSASTRGEVDSARDRGVPSSITSFREVISFNIDSKLVVEVEAKEKTSSKRRDEMPDQGNPNNGKRRASSSPDIGAWKIVIADEESKERKPPETWAESLSPARAHGFLNFMKVAELAAKVKWSSFGKVKNADGRPIEQGTSSFFGCKGITRVSQVRIPSMLAIERAMAAPLISLSG